MQIIEVEMPFDKTKNQRKGFCFITFESEQVVNELLKTPKQTIKDKEVSISLPLNGWLLFFFNKVFKELELSKFNLFKILMKPSFLIFVSSMKCFKIFNRHVITSSF